MAPANFARFSQATIVKDCVFFACSNVWTPAAGKAQLALEHAQGLGVRLWLNGFEICNGNGSQFVVNLQRGWNRVVMKTSVVSSNADWCFVGCGFIPMPDATYETENIRWSTRLPKASAAMPVIVGSRVFVQSDDSDVICLDKMTGKPLWARCTTLIDALSNAEIADYKLDEMKTKSALMQESLQDWVDGKVVTADRSAVGREIVAAVKSADRGRNFAARHGDGCSGSTPVSDGESIFTHFARHGTIAAFSMDGVRKFTVFINSGISEGELSSSPILVGDTLVILINGRCIGLDKATGKQRWEIAYHAHPRGSPITMKVDGRTVIVLPDCSVVGEDGTSLRSALGLGSIYCTPAPLGDRFLLFERSGLASIVGLPGSSETKSNTIYRVDVAAISQSGINAVSSPVGFENRFYAVNPGNGVNPGLPIMFVLDREGKILINQPLPLYPQITGSSYGAGISASLAIADQRLFVMDNSGTTLVLKPADTYHELARNVIQHFEDAQEHTVSALAFDGERIYIRGSNNLYCVGKR